MMTKFRVRYIGNDRADIRNGEVYEATDLSDCTTMYGVIDRTGEMYAYPKSWFEIVTE